MLLYLVRHADALAAGGPDIPDDASRPLSTRGAGEARKLARALARLAPGCGPLPAAVWCSPLVRARQTAEPLARRLGVPLAVEPALGIPPDVEALERRIAAARPAALVLVGHEPFMGELGSWLLTGKPSGFLAMPKAGVLGVALPGCTLTTGDMVLYLPVEVSAVVARMDKKSRALSVVEGRVYRKDAP